MNENKNGLTSNIGVIIFLLIIFFPVGLFFMWKNKVFSKNVRIVISAIFAILVVLSLPNAFKQSKEDVLYTDTTDKSEVTTIEVTTTEVTTTEETTTEETTTEVTTEAVPERADSIGKSNKDISDLGKLTVTDVFNDVTGNWKYTTIYDTTDFLEYAASYYHTYFKNDNEIHAIINFFNNTTTKISKYKYNNELNITVHEYVKGEENDAYLMCTGMVYSDFVVYLDNGDIVELKTE